MLIHQNPYQGLKLIEAVASAVAPRANSSKSLSGIETQYVQQQQWQQLVLIHQNPYQGLKQGGQPIKQQGLTC